MPTTPHVAPQLVEDLQEKTGQDKRYHRPQLTDYGEARNLTRSQPVGVALDNRDQYTGAGTGASFG